MIKITETQPTQELLSHRLTNLKSRPRRLRSSATMRSMVRESQLKVEKLIYPLFLIEGAKLEKPIASMPGISQKSIDVALNEIEAVSRDGIPAILLFGIPQQKDAIASSAWHENGVIQNAIRQIKKRFPHLIVIADTCLCEYTDHGHCGMVDGQSILNDPSLSILAKTAVAQAEAGADIIAPSDMMDGRIGHIREALDSHGFVDVPILAYSAKFASALYGPFRQAAESAPKFGDRYTYQMDPANQREALKEILLDIDEGADIILIKPALSYLDIVCQARQITNLPIAAYNVSGEYSMVKAAAAKGWVDERKIVLETLTGVVRAGADLIITYHARDIANWLTH